MVFFLSLFATNMTAFAILGSSGQAYRQGIGIYGLMASSSGLVIPLTIFFIGTRLWALGKRFGHQTQVAFFRDRWECDAIGTVIFALSALMLVPYMIISIMGGGTVLAHLSDVGGTRSPIIPYPVGCAVVAVVVTMGVFLGGMRGTVWVNILQTTLFLCFGAVAVVDDQPRAARRLWGVYLQTRRRSQDQLPGDARKDAAAGLLELHPYPAVVHHVPAHGDHVLFRAESDGLPADGGSVSPRHHADLAAVRLSRCPGRRHARQSGRCRWHPAVDAGEICAGLAGWHSRRRDHLRRHGLGCPPGAGVQHHVHQRHLTSTTAAGRNTARKPPSISRARSSSW